MAELIFIATTIFVAYTLFSIIGDKNTAAQPERTESEKTAVTPVPLVVATEPVAEVQSAAKPATKRTTAAKTAAVKQPAKAAKPKAVAKKTASAVAATSSAVAVDSLKNPKTGEVVKIPASYAFAKRWIKDALVEEKLLDKVYKNNELDDAANAKIQIAMAQFKQISKYQP